MRTIMCARACVLVFLSPLDSTVAYDNCYLVFDGRDSVAALPLYIQPTLVRDELIDW